MREAIFEKRFRGPSLRKFVDQASRLPYKLDETGKYKMTPKDQMRLAGIKSPDLSDTCCFAFLADYIPADIGGTSRNRQDEYLKLARAFMGEEV